MKLKEYRELMSDHLKHLRHVLIHSPYRTDMVEIEIQIIEEWFEKLKEVEDVGDTPQPSASLSFKHGSCCAEVDYSDDYNKD